MGSVKNNYLQGSEFLKILQVTYSKIHKVEICCCAQTLVPPYYETNQQVA